MRANRMEAAARCVRTPHAPGGSRPINESIILAAALLMLAAFFGNSHGQCIDYDDYPQWAGAVGTPTQTGEIAIAGDYAYMTGSFPPGLLVVDISDPTAPDVMSFLEMGSWTINGLDVYQNYVYVANGSDGLQVVDVTDPAAPVIVGNWDGSLSIVSDVIVYRQYGPFLCVVGTGGLRILDISVPTSPVEVGSLNMSIDWYGGMAIDYAALYIANGSIGLSIVSLVDVTAPMLLNTVPTNGVAGDVVLSGSTAYVANGTAGVAAVYVSNPATASVSWAVDTPGSARDLTLLGSYLLVADDASGLTVVDKRDGLQALHRTLDGPGSTSAIAIKGSCALLAAGEHGIQVADITSYTGIGHLPTEQASAVCVRGNYAYVGDYSAGLKVVDISEPSRPVVVGSVAREAWEASYVTVADDYLYWADFSDGLLIVDITTPSNPTIVGRVDLRPMNGTSFVAVQGNYAYVPRGTYGLQVIDISDKAHPIPVRLVDTPGTALTLVVDGDYAYLADKNLGLQVIDISNPTTASIVGNVTTVMNAIEVHRHLDRIFVRETNAGPETTIEAFRIEAPGQLSWHERVDLGVLGRIVGFHGPYVYVAYNFTGAHGDPGIAPVLMSDPYSLPGHPVPNRVYWSTIVNGLLYLACYTDGLRIFPVSCDATYAAPVPDPGLLPLCTGSTITSTHPNPFNPEVRVDYDMFSSGPAFLEIHDIQGRHVQSRALGQLDAGHHVATWNGIDGRGRKVPSGIYFVRIRTAGATSPSKKVVMLE